MRKWIQHTLRLLDRTVSVGLWLVGGWIFTIVFLFASYNIPSSSMKPTLLPGDYILVDKTYLGARIFNLQASIEHKPFKIYRVWGRNQLKAGDITIFNYPYPQTRDSIGFDILSYYVKRCVGVPGDSLSIDESYYQINGHPLTVFPSAVCHLHDSLHQVFTTGEKHIKGVSINAYPKQKEIGWTTINFGPFYIPRKGDYLTISRQHFLLYRTLIEWETGQKLIWHEDGAYLNGKKLIAYHFQENYYFMAGDNVFDSVDSRYWGLLPESYIAGKAVRIWQSKNRFTGDMNWDRVWKRIE